MLYIFHKNLHFFFFNERSIRLLPVNTANTAVGICSFDLQKRCAEIQFCKLNPICLIPYRTVLTNICSQFADVNLAQNQILQTIS